jgi:hypothetical protein
VFYIKGSRAGREEGAGEYEMYMPLTPCSGSARTESERVPRRRSGAMAAMREVGRRIVAGGGLRDSVLSGCLILGTVKVRCAE